MTTLKFANIKCGGCEKTIKSSLERLGIKNVKIDIAGQAVSFEGDKDKVKKELSRLGYPEAGSAEAKKFSKKAKSFLSCAIGRVKK